MNRPPALPFLIAFTQTRRFSGELRGGAPRAAWARAQDASYSAWAEGPSSRGGCPALEAAATVPGEPEVTTAPGAALLARASPVSRNRNKGAPCTARVQAGRLNPSSRILQWVASPRSFPLLVEGSWGPDPPKNLSTKLQVYFQSFTRSGGGECEVRLEPWTPPRFLMLFSAEDVEVPSHWSDMNQESVCVVDLPPSDPEYRAVASQFNRTCSSFVIEKIERIQNLDLWNSYQAKKKTMDAKNGNIINEKHLFYGADEVTVPLVNRNGFNCSYAGKNAVSFGKGTYFAVNASYSANDTYSRPDANGKKYMYSVRVLTGIYTPGNPTLIVPPPKDSQNPTDLYDSVTDNVQSPNLFVVFYDWQAYPEYLITFQK